MPANAENAKEVTKVDQEKINKFSRYNQQLGDIDVAVAKRDKIVTDIKDAAEIIDDLQIVEEDAPGKWQLTLVDPFTRAILSLLPHWRVLLPSNVRECWRFDW